MHRFNDSNLGMGHVSQLERAQFFQLVLGHGVAHELHLLETKTNEFIRSFFKLFFFHHTW